jgi:hypothetical protein
MTNNRVVNRDPTSNSCGLHGRRDEEGRVLRDARPARRARASRQDSAACHRQPGPYGQQIDRIGGATSSTSKVIIVSRSTRADGQWSVSKVILSRSARWLMKGWVRVPQPAASG